MDRDDAELCASASGWSVARASSSITPLYEVWVELMSTKVPEPCPLCGVATLPEEKTVAIENAVGQYPVKLWRYRCICGWVWANGAQRIHNQEMNRRGRRDARRMHFA